MNTNKIDFATACEEIARPYILHEMWRRIHKLTDEDFAKLYTACEACTDKGERLYVSSDFQFTHEFKDVADFLGCMTRGRKFNMTDDFVCMCPKVRWVITFSRMDELFDESVKAVASYLWEWRNEEEAKVLVGHEPAAGVEKALAIARELGVHPLDIADKIAGGFDGNWAERMIKEESK